MTFEILPAHKNHLPGIYALVEKNVRRQSLLPRSRKSIESSLQNFVVALVEGEVVGCGSLLDYGDGLVEIRSLAIGDDWNGKGIGSGIIRRLVENARSLGCQTVFALTTAVPLFQRCDFEIVQRDCFPDKVIRFCAACPKLHACDETAVVFQLADTPFQCSSEQQAPSRVSFQFSPDQAGLSA